MRLVEFSFNAKKIKLNGAFFPFFGRAMIPPNVCISLTSEVGHRRERDINKNLKHTDLTANGKLR